jgi:ABC-type Mn2+/Zn2+ transport system permease subunit
VKQDVELEQWRDQWQSASEAPALDDLSKRVARESRFLRMMLLGDILVTVVIGGAVIVYAMLDPRPATAILVAATWLFIAVAWFFGLSNRKSTWSPSSSTTAAFLDLSIRRCRGNLRASVFGAVLYLVEMAFCLSWLYRETSLSSTVMISIALITLLLAALLIVYRKKKRADLNYLLNLQHELETG